MSPLALLVLAIVSAQAPQSTVQPWTYRSPSGAVELFVDPTSRFGAGPARCRLTRGGEIQWEREVPFTFYDALVEEDGSAAGYAYSQGIGSYSGEFVVAVLAPDGSERASSRWPRPAPRAPHGAPYPTVARLRAERRAVALRRAADAAIPRALTRLASSGSLAGLALEFTRRTWTRAHSPACEPDSDRSRIH